MNIQTINITEIKPYENNPRKISEKAIDKVALSLKEFGWQQPIVVDEKNVIIAGHTRHKAAEKLGYREVPILKAVGLSDEKVKAYRFMDNRSHEETSWDWDLAVKEISELIDQNQVDEKLLGFDEGEFDYIKLRFQEMETDKSIKENTDGSDESVKTSNTFFNPSDENTKFVEFSILLTEADRKELYNILNEIKNNHNLKTFAEAIMFLVRR
jgi:site-specific DNA-methyltransferase (adenine-specific)